MKILYLHESYLNVSSLLTQPETIKSIGVTFKDGVKPRFYINGEFVGEGENNLTIDNTAIDDLIIGNSNELDASTPIGIKQVFVGNKALTDREMLALHEQSPVINMASTEIAKSGIDNLDPFLTINGQTVAPVFRYKGGDANATNWPTWGFGETLTLQTGTAPSYNQGSPYEGLNDDSVKFNKGGYYSTATPVVVVAPDIIIEGVIKTRPAADAGGNQGILSCSSGGLTNGFVLYFGNTNGLNLEIYDNPNYGLIYSSNVAYNTWIYFVIAINHSEAVGATQSKVWINTIDCSNARSDFSALVDSTDTAAFQVGALFGGSVSSGNIAFISMYSQNDWLANGAGGMTEVEELIADRYAKLIAS